MSDKNTKNKINFLDLLQDISEDSNIDYDVVRKVYTSMVKILIKKLFDGFCVELRGFGSFCLQKHRGHPVQFAGKKQTIGDYIVLKFSTSGSMKQRLNSNITMTQKSNGK